MPEENEWEVCKRKREKILKSIQFCGLFVVLQQRQKPTQGSQTELQLLSFTFPFFPNSPAPHRTVHFVYSMCVSFFLFLYSFSACILFFQFRQYFLVFFSYLFFFFIFYLVSCPRIACVVLSLGANAGRVVLVATLAAFHLLYPSLSFHSPTLCGLYQFSACRHSSH